MQSFNDKFKTGLKKKHAYMSSFFFLYVNVDRFGEAGYTLDRL